jgi:hypothetical protein
MNYHLDLLKINTIQEACDYLEEIKDEFYFRGYRECEE